MGSLNSCHWVKMHLLPYGALFSDAAVPNYWILCWLYFSNRRVARIWIRGGGGYFERVRSVQTTLTRIFIDLESVSVGLSKIWDEMSRKDRKFNRFFRPKLGDLQKKKRSSPKFRAIFRPISQVQTFEGRLFSYGGGAIFHFSQKIGLFFPPPPPGYATVQ